MRGLITRWRFPLVVGAAFLVWSVLVDAFGPGLDTGSAAGSLQFGGLLGILVAAVPAPADAGGRALAGLLRTWAILAVTIPVWFVGVDLVLGGGEDLRGSVTRAAVTVAVWVALTTASWWYDRRRPLWRTGHPAVVETIRPRPGR